MKADLDWKAARQAAMQYRDQGLKLFWEIDLGLFAYLEHPLDDQMQFLALCLSLEHFRDTLWKEFHGETVGVSIYCGSGDFSDGFKWDEVQIFNLQEWLQETFETVEEFEKETGIAAAAFDEITPDLLRKSKEGGQLMALFCRDVAVEYIELLATRLPDAMPFFVKLDMSNVFDPLLQAQLLTKERYERFQLDVKGNLFPLTALETQPAAIGICFPSLDRRRPSHYHGLRRALEWLIEQKKPFRLIPETQLTTEWEGLDYLIYVPASLSSQGKRKLQGFCAAGGTVVTLNEKLGLPNEITFNEFVLAGLQKDKGT